MKTYMPFYNTILFSIHFHVFVHNLIKSSFGHSLYCLQGFREVHTIRESKTSFGNILGTYLACKVVKATKEISVYLLQTLDTARFCRLQDATFKELICFLFALPIDGVVAVGKPIEKVISTIVGVVLCQQYNILTIKNICHV